MGTPKCFMVVEDDNINNSVCKYAIRKLFSEAEIRLCIGPEEALVAIKVEYGKADTNISTVLFPDINMPSMTGWDFLNAFKDFSEDIQKQFTIYNVSSSIDQCDKDKAELNLLVSGFYSRPLKLENIRQIFAPVMLEHSIH